MDIAPFVQQRILREAGSLEEAVAIVQAAQPFSAWTIFCSDAAAGRARRIEFNGEAIRVGPVAEATDRADRHFLHPDLVEHLFDDHDAHFTPTFGKWLETRSRFAMVEQALAAAPRATPTARSTCSPRGATGNCWRWRSGVASTSRPPGSSARSGGCRARRTASLAASSVAIRRDGPGKTRHG